MYLQASKQHKQLKYCQELYYNNQELCERRKVSTAVAAVFQSAKSTQFAGSTASDTQTYHFSALAITNAFHTSSVGILCLPGRLLASTATTSPSPLPGPQQLNVVSTVTSWTGIRGLRDRSRLAVVVAHHLLDVVQFGLQILTAALLHPVVWCL